MTAIFQPLRENAATAPLGVLHHFVTAARGVGDMAGLRDLVGDATKALGFDHYAIVHHVNFGLPSRHVRLSNYPLDWLAYVREQARLPDPVIRAAERHGSGFTWDRLDGLLSMTGKEQDYMRRAARHGIAQGYTVANHVPGERPGSCNFVVRPGRPLPEASVPAVQALGHFAFEAARRLLAAGDEPSENWVIPAPLSERQRECLLLVARGKSDSIIAQLLDIRPRTVNGHIEAAKRRYAVATRAQLLVRALYHSEICFSEIL